MPENTNKVEQHGCIVCGKLYNLLVIYDPAGRMMACTVTSPGGRVVPNKRPLVACVTHTEEQVEMAVNRVYPSEDSTGLEED
jgi:hypothetical protein